MQQDDYKYIGPVYDFVAKDFLGSAHNSAALLCKSLQAQRVLEIGAGTGLLLRRLATVCQLTVGLEYSTAMLAQASRNLKNNSLLQHYTDAKHSHFLLQADGSHPPFMSNSFDAVVFSLILHESPAGGEVLLEQGLSLAPRVIVLDWRVPERNLDYLLSFWVPLVERMAGKAHFQRFRHYMNNGGLHGLAYRIGARVQQERSLYGGSLVLAVLER